MVCKHCGLSIRKTSHEGLGISFEHLPTERGLPFYSCAYATGDHSNYSDIQFATPTESEPAALPVILATYLPEVKGRKFRA